MALPAILGASRAVLSGSKLARTANIGSKLLGRRKKDPPGEKTEESKGEIVSTPSSSLVPSISFSSEQTAPETSGVSTPKSSSGKSTLEEDVRYIREKTVEIDKLLKSSFSQRKKEDQQRQKRVKSLLRTRKEDKFEKKKSGGMLGKAGSAAKKPVSGIFDWLKNYVTSIIVGFVAIKLLPLLPILEPIIKTIFKVGEFFIDVAGLLLNGFITFVDWGYKAYDATAGFIKSIGGEDAAKIFDKFSGVFTTFANLAIIAGLAAARATDGPDFGRKGGKGKSIGKGPKTRVRSKPQEAFQAGRPKGMQPSGTTSPAAARRFASRFGRDAAETRFGKDAVSGLGGKYGRSGATNALRKGATGIANKIGGRGGVKALASLGKIGKFIKVPVIGGIISAVLALMSGEPIGKALFAGIGTTIGGALGTLIPIPVLGTILGGFIGDYVGNLLGTLFFGGGIKEAGAKLGKDILGVFTGVGKGAKAIFGWIFGGGLFNLLKNVGGGLAKFAFYLLNPGGLLWDILKAGGSALKAVTGFIFGGGLFNIIKNLTGGIFKFVTYILNPGGLLFDALKQGGKIAKAIFDFAINAIGSAATFIKDWIGGIFTRFNENFPSIGIPEGWGIQTSLGAILGWIPFLKPYMKGGRLTAFPDLSMFVPILGLPFFFAHLGKSMFPGSFFEGMPSGIGQSWEGSKNAVQNIANGVDNAATAAVDGTKRATGGFLDAITFNAFDFDKQNEVEKKEEGGSVGSSDGDQDPKLESTKLVPTVSTPDLSVSDIGSTLKGAGSSGEKAGKLYKPAGIIALIELGNELKKLPIVGEAMAAALRIAVGIMPQSSVFKSMGADLINFTSLESVEGIADSQGDIKQGVSKFETGGEIDAIVSIDSTDNTLKADNLGRFLKSEMSGLKLSTVDEAEKSAEGLASFFGNFLGALGSMVPGAPNLSGGGSAPGGGKPGVATGAVGASDLYTEIGANAPQWDIFRNTVALIESGGKYDIFGGSGDHYDGRYQMGEAAKIDGSKIAGVEYPGHSNDPNNQSRAAYRANPELQETIFTAFTVANHRYLMGNETYASANVERKLEILGYAHNQGMGGAEKWMTTGEVGADGFGTKGTKYTDMIAANFRAKKSGGELQVAEGAVDVPSVTLSKADMSTADMSTADVGSRDRGEGSKLAGELGHFLNDKGLGSYGSGTHQHPEHPAWPKESGHSANSLHYESQGARALDIGGWGPNLFKRKGESGTDDQTKILSAINEFNSSNGISPVELYHEGNEPSGHSDHVHIAYQGGGLIKRPDSGKYSGLQETMPYDKGSTKVMIQPMIIEKSVPSDPTPTSSGGGGISMNSGEVNSNADRFFVG